MTPDAKWIVDAWAEELKAVLQFLTAEDWAAAVSTPESGSAPVGYFWWSQRFNLDPNAQVWLGAPALAWSELGARVLQSAGVDLIEQASAKSTYLETIQQSMSGLARCLADRTRRVVEASTGRDEAPSRAGATFEVILTTGGFDLPPLRLVVSDELCAGLAVNSNAVQKASPEPLVAPVPVAVTTAAPSTPPIASPNVSVLLDVQMPVSICFGRASMPLREVLKLTSGSAVELDRRPDDEVDIIVNDCVIARGEVVVIDGNYGVKVTGIVSREQRLALRAGAR